MCIICTTLATCRLQQTEPHVSVAHEVCLICARPLQLALRHVCEMLVPARPSQALPMQTSLTMGVGGWVGGCVCLCVCVCVRTTPSHIPTDSVFVWYLCVSTQLYKKRKEQTMPVNVNTMRSQELYWAAQVNVTSYLLW